jgi:GT2 family glycosyltransferase
MTSLTREHVHAPQPGTENIYPPASIIIVGYNSRHHLDRCFNSLFNLGYPGRFEVVFVDNQSSDDSAAYVRDTYAQVRVLEPNQNLGYAGGNNFGATVATGDVLVFLNPDTEVVPGWLRSLVRPIATDHTVGLTTSRILLMRERDKINTCGNDVSLAGITWCRGAGQPAMAFDQDADVPAVSGCSFAIRRSLFEQLGGFDERFFMYLEDTDLSWRARALGYRCRFVAESVVFHDYSISLSPWKIGLVERNRYRMLGKHLSLRSVVALMPALLSAEILTWGYATLRGPRHLFAKARATAWALTQIGPVVRKRWRPTETAILRAHESAPPVVDGLGGPASRIAQRAIGVIARRTAALSLRLLPDRSAFVETGPTIEDVDTLPSESDATAPDDVASLAGSSTG